VTRACLIIVHEFIAGLLALMGSNEELKSVLVEDFLRDVGPKVGPTPTESIRRTPVPGLGVTP